MTVQAHDRWLSSGAEVLIEDIEQDPTAFHCDVLIIGSGYGGAVAAARLAGATSEASGEAIRVYVLERGNEYLPGEFPGTFAEMPGHVRFSKQDGSPARGRPTGLFDLRLGNVNVVLGNGLGGGSLINAAVMEEPSADAFMDPHWPKDFRVGALENGYRAAKTMLAPEQMPGSVPKLDSLLRAGHQMVAYERRKAWLAIDFGGGTTPAGVDMHACLRCGDCVTGCNHRAKKSLDTNYLALAQANGARLFCGATAHRLMTVPNGYAVDFFLTDTAKTRADRDRPYTVRARHVILAAGALGSTEFLLRSQSAGLPIRADGLGTRFSTNGDLIAVAHRQNRPAHASAMESEPPKDRDVGPTITGLLRKATTGLPIVIEEFGIPAPLRRLFGEVVTTMDALHSLPEFDGTTHDEHAGGIDPMAVNDHALDHTSVYGMMGDDGAQGKIALAANDDLLTDGRTRIDWGNVAQAAVFEQQMAALREAHRGLGGLGGRVLPNPLWKPLPELGELGDLRLGATTVHPLGGCPMSEPGGDGVVDSHGRVYAETGSASTYVDGLAVLDGSIVPTSLGINPALTIAALAERALPVLAKSWKLRLRGSTVLQPVPRPARRDRSQASPPKPTSVTIVERLCGDIVIDKTPFALEADVAFAPADIQDLRHLRRRLVQPSVELRLTTADGKSTTMRCEGTVSLLPREASLPRQRVRRVKDLVRDKVKAALDFDLNETICTRTLLRRLASHFGEVRLLRYTWTVVAASPLAPLQPGQTLELTKRLELIAGDRGNPWRQLSEGELQLHGRGSLGHMAHLGRLHVDLDYFVEQMKPLLTISKQQDAPNALGDLAELALWLLRVILRIHLVNFLPPPLPDQPKSDGRKPGKVGAVIPDVSDVHDAPNPAPAPAPAPAPTPGGSEPPPRCQLAHYTPEMPESPDAALRPVLLIHGYGASGSTFAHPSIPRNLVQTLLEARRHVWVLDLRTSIGLEQRTYWPFEEVAKLDIPAAIAQVRRDSKDARVDVVAHCIGSAMFCVESLRNRTLHESIGAVVLSQVGPLLRASPMNRFRGYLASYLQQFIGVEQFDVAAERSPATFLVDAVLTTFPYPDGDGDAHANPTVDASEFAAVRHRADGIFGQTMRLKNIGPKTLRSLADIYGWVTVKGLAQVSHFAREQLLTDAEGMNTVVTQESLARQFAFPVLLVHGRQNAVFDWKGAWDSFVLLRGVFSKKKDWREQPPTTPGDLLRFSTSRRQQLMVLAEYGHQDCLIGENAGRDIFPGIVRFLDEFKNLAAPVTQDEPPEYRAEWPWRGPVLGRADRKGAGAAARLRCRIAIAPSPARANSLAVFYVPAKRVASDWNFSFDKMVGESTTNDKLRAEALQVLLRPDRLADYDGFAVVTLHNDLPDQRSIDVAMWKIVDGPFDLPAMGPDDPEIERKVRDRLTVRPDPVQGSLDAKNIDAAVVRLDPAWIGAAMLPFDQATVLSFAIASCQYPPGLLDGDPAQASCKRLVDHIDAAAPDRRPQLLLLVGDQVYVDERAGLYQAGVDDVNRAYVQGFGLQAWRALTRRLPTYPMLDDHEVEDGWEPRPTTTDLEREALHAYRSNQHTWQGEGLANGSLSYGLAAGGFPFLMLDTRSLRQPRALRASAKAKPVAEALINKAFDAVQLKALLANVPGDQPLFIASSVAMLPLQRRAVFGATAECVELDDWNGYPRSQFDLLELLRDAPTRQVILLSGDRHMSSVSSLSMQGAHGTVEVISIVSSGLYAPWPFANAVPEDFWLDGPVTLRLGQRQIDGHVTTIAKGTTDGFATVRIAKEEDESKGWTLEVALDLAGGRTVCKRQLGIDGLHASWEVDTSLAP
ncbi:alpha/beta fold hydrolase [Variovorax sp. IB41]|uniref:alpha/beta fold hydrolase n=1 Tax=Variovorax sp. IB41 TaxID=2779370 RepID=UPI0018E85F73|nr:alpha/beta fold hydrolase [Variovorax sp. IB41]MBJ2156647.1 alpha/beta fold hydrolase [Variovorax sp. IB41]